MRYIANVIFSVYNNCIRGYNFFLSPPLIRKNIMNKRVNPLKRFGQNYLTDRNIILKIIKEFDPLQNDTVLEIGPGSGALTSELAKIVDHLIAVEIDKRVIDDLLIQFPKAELVNKDFLDVDLNVYSKTKIRIIGNIPYNITSSILFKLIENREIISDALLMVQYEVAKRITGKRGTKDYGILSVILNHFAETDFCFKISPNVFYPKPNVDSAIIKIKFNKVINAEIEDDLFIKVVKASFGNRRKTLKNSLSNSIFKSINFANEKFDFSRRAEELSADEFIDLSKIIKRKLDG